MFIMNDENKRKKRVNSICRSDELKCPCLPDLCLLVPVCLFDWLCVCGCVCAIVSGFPELKEVALTVCFLG